MWVPHLIILSNLSNTHRMGQFLRWRNLKHIDDLATNDLTDGQIHIDILKIAGDDVDQDAIARTRLIVDDFFRHLNGEDLHDHEAMNEGKETAQFKQQSGRRIPRSKLPPASGDNQWIFRLSSAKRGQTEL
ncbi:hypothetical protein B0H19DRAFT_1079337 [Mycena capillaripes]|nr:hypothetical protein B0H19DRAFT_1079337 [Mycena capillaripes]